jgi:hypothetical protein
MQPIFVHLVCRVRSAVSSCKQQARRCGILVAAHTGNGGTVAVEPQRDRIGNAGVPLAGPEGSAE